MILAEIGRNKTIPWIADKREFESIFNILKISNSQMSAAAYKLPVLHGCAGRLGHVYEKHVVILIKNAHGMYDQPLSFQAGSTALKYN